MCSRFLFLLLTLFWLLACPGRGRAAEATETTDAQQAQKARQLHESGNWCWLARQTGTAALLAGMFFTGLSVRLRQRIEDRIGRGLRVVVVFWLLTALCAGVLWLVYAYFAGYVRLHYFELSRQSFPRWLSHATKELALTTLIGAALVWIPYWLHDRYPRAWSVLTGCGVALLVVLTTLVAPIWIDPLFHEFQRLEDPQLEQRLLRLAERCGIQADRVFQINVSQDTRAVNAYVKGLFGTSRIVMWDTTLRQLSAAEIDFIMAHEMGHYVMGHVNVAVFWGCLSALAGTLVVVFLASRILQRVGPKLGVTAVSDPAALPLVLLIALAIWIGGAPIRMAFSQQAEHDADVFGLEVTQSNSAAESTFLRMRKINLSVEFHSTFYKIFRATHPSSGERAAFFRTYRPWETGDPLRFRKFIKDPPR